ncbi:50S ribosomal protein L21 [bacterium]|nr:MAG: 50S ribosomal protein L21 [bacterium]QQR61706.1 MAG: 50S ribosomal protein L21 [bacterium]QQR62726.1 MAG: 50S ribosomal protein L21 [bacterium]
MENPKNYGRYAIIATGGKQYQVVEGKTVAVELLAGNAGDAVTFDQVLFRKTAEGVFEVGQPTLKTVVTGSIVKHVKGKKLIVFRFKRRKKVRVKRGHRQQATVVRIEAI